MLKIKVEIRDGRGMKIAEYVMDHDDPAQRRRLGESCRNSFEAGQSVHTWPVQKDDK